MHRRVTITITESITMDKKKLYALYQINGGTFPTGGFSQSWGLETYVAEGEIDDADAFNEFLHTYILHCTGMCEGPIILRAYELAEPLQVGELRELEQLSNASRVTRESREAGLRMGKAFFRIMAPILEDSRLDEIEEIFTGKDVSYPVIYGIVCRLLDIEAEEALRAYVYSAASTLVQSAVKLVPLGNTEAQEVLFRAADVMEKAVELAVETPIDEITNFCPGTDIAGLRHESLPVRLYMS